MSDYLTVTQLVEITENFKKVGQVLKQTDYIKVSNDYLLKLGFDSLSLEEQFELLKKYKMALIDLKNNSAIGSQNRKFYVTQTDLMNRYEKQLREVELDQVYEPLEELGIQRNPKKKVQFSIGELKNKQKEIDKKGR